MNQERDRLTTAGLYVVGGAAAIMSFTALADLAWLLGVRAEIPLPPWRPSWEVPAFRVAWLLPLAVDVFAFTASRVWLQGRTNPDALRVAQRAAWAAIGTTVLGNGAHGYLVSQGTGQPWWWSVVVSAIPALALGALVHLAHLVGRGPGEPTADEQANDPWAGLHDDVLAEPWARAIAAWAGPGDVGGERVPDRSESDEVLAADLRAKAGEGGRELTQDEVRERYRVGATRAARLRQLAQQPPALTLAARDAG